MIDVRIPDTVVDRDTWRDLVELDNLGEGLPTWECDFVDSLMRQLLDGRRATGRQQRLLQVIREERLP